MTNHDTPSEIRTYIGRPCPRKGCKPTITLKDGRLASEYFQGSRLCVACWGRLMKRTKK